MTDDDLSPKTPLEAATAEGALFDRPVEAVRAWDIARGMVRGRLAAVTPAAPSQARMCEIVDASTGIAWDERCNASQQLWTAARNADAKTVERLLFGEEGKLVCWLPQEGRWRVRMTSDTEKLVLPSQLLAIGDASSRTGSKQPAAGGYDSRSTTCPGPSRGSTGESMSSRSAAADVMMSLPTATPTATTPHPHSNTSASSSRTPEGDTLLSRAISNSSAAGGPADDCASFKGASGNLMVGMQVRVLSATSSQIRVDWEMHQEKADALVYKNRRFTSQALHAAVAPLAPHPTAEVEPTEAVRRENVRKVVKMLLMAKANPSAPAKVPGKSNDQRPSREVQAIHMAAGSGDEELIRILVSYGADVQSQAKNNGNPYYLPLHDAVWFDQRQAARTLVELHANVDAKNSKGETPLHLAAHLGHVEMVAAMLLLDDGRELLRRTCNKHWTPLDVALQSARFPPRKLYLFTHKMCAKDKAEAFLKVARICPMVAPELLRDDSVPLENFQERTISKAWREHLQEAAEKDKVITAQHLAELVEVAPLAAVELVDALTASPPVEDSKHHPLPFRANVPLSGEACRLSCAYERDSKWLWHTDGEHSPSWHKVLAPENPKHGQEVEIKILKLPGVLNLDLMHVLAATPEQVVFAKLAIHAVLRCAWDRTQWIHSMELLIQSTAMICMVLWVVCPDMGHLGERILWCIVAAEACSECVLIGWMNWRCLSLLGVRRWSQWASRIILRGVLALMNLVLAIEISGTLRPQPGDMVFASSSLLHWVHFLWELRVFRATGKRLLPMMRALMLLGGMLVVLFFLTIAFAHAFWAMERDILAWWDLFSVLKLLFTGEVDSGIDPLELDETSVPVNQKIFLCILTNGAIIIFLVCFVNLFIAVLSDNYQAEQERLIFTLFRERAHVCCNLFLAPRAGDHWMKTALERGWRQRCVIALFAGIFAAGVFLWIGILYLMLQGDLPGFVGVALASVGVLVMQSIVRGWLTCDFTDDCHLWVCHDKSFEESKLLVTEDYENTEIQGRIARLRNFIHEQMKTVGMSMKNSKECLLKRHKDQERLLWEVFYQLEDLRAHLGLPNYFTAPVARQLQMGKAGRIRPGKAPPGKAFFPDKSDLQRRRMVQSLKFPPGESTTTAQPPEQVSKQPGTGESFSGELGLERFHMEEVHKQAARLTGRGASGEFGHEEEPLLQSHTPGPEMHGHKEGALDAGASLDQSACEDSGAQVKAPLLLWGAQYMQPTCARKDTEAELQGLREEVKGLRLDLQQRNEALQGLQGQVEALSADLQKKQDDHAQELQKANETVQTLRGDIQDMREDVQKQRAEGQELRVLMEQVLHKFDKALVAAATGQEILRKLQPAPRSHGPKAPPDPGPKAPPDTEPKDLE